MHVILIFQSWFLPIDKSRRLDKSISSLVDNSLLFVLWDNKKINLRSPYKRREPGYDSSKDFLGKVRYSKSVIGKRMILESSYLGNIGKMLQFLNALFYDGMIMRHDFPYVFYDTFGIDDLKHALSPKSHRG